MGLSWSDPKLVKDDTLLLLTAPINRQNESIIWFINSQERGKSFCKDRGFSLGKKGKKYWELCYWHEIRPDSLDKADDIPNWKLEFLHNLGEVLAKVEELQAVF